jgi:hypothetical protein
MTDILDPALDQIKCCNQIADKLRAAIKSQLNLLKALVAAEQSWLRTREDLLLTSFLVVVVHAR